MTIEELEDLRTRASKQTGDAIRVFFGSRGWTLVSDGQRGDLNDKPFVDVVKILYEWAMPPKPATVTIEIPFAAAEWAAGCTVYPDANSKAVVKACQEALKPWQSTK